MTDLTFAVADLHGRYDCLCGALDAIEAHGMSQAAGARSVVFLGDYVDRGPQSRQVIERLMSGPPKAWEWICLRGNHEQMMIDYFAGRDEWADWISNGGEATLQSFLESGKLPHPEAQIPDDVISWMSDLSHIAWDKHRVFVHADVDDSVPLGQQNKQVMLWSRSADTRGYGHRHIVHGHTPYRNGPKVSAGRTNLDTMAFATGRLVVGIFDDDLAGGAVQFLEVRR